jgi:hypothetical protein
LSQVLRICPLDQRSCRTRCAEVRPDGDTHSFGGRQAPALNA